MLRRSTKELDFIMIKMLMTCSLKCTRKSKDHDDKYELSSRTTHFSDVDIKYLSTEDFLRDIVRRYGKFQKFTENVFIL